MRDDDYLYHFNETGDYTHSSEIVGAHEHDDVEVRVREAGT